MRNPMIAANVVGEAAMTIHASDSQYHPIIFKIESNMSNFLSLLP